MIINKRLLIKLILASIFFSIVTTFYLKSNNIYHYSYDSKQFEDTLKYNINNYFNINVDNNRNQLTKFYKTMDEINLTTYVWIDFNDQIINNIKKTSNDIKEVFLKGKTRFVFKSKTSLDEINLKFEKNLIDLQEIYLNEISILLQNHLKNKQDTEQILSSIIFGNNIKNNDLELNDMLIDNFFLEISLIELKDMIGNMNNIIIITNLIKNIDNYLYDYNPDYNNQIIKVEGLRYLQVSLVFLFIFAISIVSLSLLFFKKIFLNK